METFSTSGVTSDGSRKSDVPTTLPPDWNIQRVRRESTTDSLLSIPGLYSFDLDMTREVAPFIRSKSCPSSPLNRPHARSNGPALAGSGMVHTPRSASYTSLASLTSQNSTSSSPATSTQQHLSGGGISEEQISQLGKHLSQLQRNGDGMNDDDDDDLALGGGGRREQADAAKIRRRRSTGLLGLAPSASLDGLSPMKRALKVFHRSKTAART